MQESKEEKKRGKDTRRGGVTKGTRKEEDSEGGVKGEGRSNHQACRE